MNNFPRLFLAALLGTTLLRGTFAWADMPSGPDATRKAQELVRQLGSDEYTEREKASEQLRELGLVAKGALEKGAKDEDAEVRRRCRDLLPAVLEMDLRKRIAKFLADKEGKAAHDIPHWAAFRKVAGEGPGVRQLFTEMLQGESLTFLLACADSPDRQAEVLERYAQRVQQKMNQRRPGEPPGQLSRGDWAALLFIAGQVKAGAGREQAPYIICNLLHQQLVRTVLTEGDQALAARKLLVRWMNQQTNENVIFQLTQSAPVLGLKETNEFMLAVIKDKKVRGVYLALVVVNMGKQNNKEHIPILEALLQDQTQLGQVQFNQTRGNTELRDVALAMLVHITGQSHKDYGFSFLSMNGNFLFTPNYAGFSTSEQREAAHKKWKTWAAAQKK